MFRTPVSTSMRAIVRTTPRLVAVLVTSLLLVLSAAPVAADAQDGVVLATEAGEEAPGPEPAGADEEGNLGAPDEHEGPPFARFVAAVLTIAAVGGAVLIGYLYFLLVKRPRSEQSSSA